MKNKERIKAVLMAQPGLTCREISDRTGLKNESLTSVINNMRDELTFEVKMAKTNRFVKHYTLK